MKAIRIIKVIILIAFIALNLLVGCVPPGDGGYVTKISQPTTSSRITYVGSMPCIEFFGTHGGVVIYGVSCDWTKFSGGAR